ncbi:hypothetical protein DH2020_042942 [Rehmannia glutinosa]|uniref:HXXXD-type acyl-transferase family protein n=1 Tax=Rehmannia glutinosa TaxID=99300 RepID=A0ABR0UM88_REHGL
MAKLQIISSSLIPMATNAIVGMSRLELTPWDLRFLLLDPIQKGILFYKPNESQELQKTIINHLKNSLSRALDFFPPLAGRLGTVKNDNNTSCFFVDCNNAGAEFTHAVASDVSVSYILEAKYIPEIINSFFPLNGLPNIEGISKPLLGVQVNELVDGLFIGCTANHAVVDGTSFWHFFNSWSEISRGFDRISKSPIFERWFPNNISDDNLPIRLPPLEQIQLLDFVPPPLHERVLHFSKENVAKLKAKANYEAGSDKISTLQALSAHLWRSVVRCRHLQNTPNNLICQEVQVTLLIGARSRIPLPEGYFGNAVYGGKIGSSETEVLRNGLGYAGLKINELVAQQTNEVAIRFVEDWVENPVIVRKGGLSFVISSSPRHNVYGNDFGWGKPIAVRSGKGQKFDGKMTLYPAAEAGGVDVEVCLAPETLQALEYDAEFKDFIT